MLKLATGFAPQFMTPEEVRFTSWASECHGYDGTPVTPECALQWWEEFCILDGARESPQENFFDEH